MNIYYINYIMVKCKKNIRSKEYANFELKKCNDDGM